MQETLPTLDEFITAGKPWPLLPLPLPDPVHWRKLKSCRLRQRQKRRLQVGRILKGMILTINALGEGRASSTELTSSDSSVASDGCRMKVPWTDARTLAVQRLTKSASCVARARRSCCLTGVHSAMAQLLKAPLDDGYIRSTGPKQIPMIADRMVEPTSQESIDMLAVLPDEDALYYSDEKHVVCKVGKCEDMFRSIEEHYGFVGGSLDEYMKYLARDDVQHLWRWDLMANIKAIAGVSTVLKKNGVDQRKLIMQCAANYMFEDPTKRADLGMGGGSALARCFIQGGSMDVAACDEDSAFTYVRVPEWMTAWQAGPPVRATLAWDLLSDDLKALISHPERTWVAPRYQRLAMGGSHSVYILMRINLHCIGKTLFNQIPMILQQQSIQRFDDVGENEACCKDDLVDVGISDDQWQLRQELRKLSDRSDGNYTVDEWCDAVRRTKHEDGRTMVVVHMFAGERREHDIQQCLEELCCEAGIRLLMLSVDLAVDPLWDFTNPSTVHQMMQLSEEGLIDIWLGGPPCSTVARARHVYLPGGPRPLRFRWALWGRHDLRPAERARVQEANLLWLNFFMLAEAVASRGGGYLMEHPADPGVEPYPSIWVLPEVLGLEQRVGGRRVHLHQCPFGGIAPKLTTLSGNLDGMEAVDGVRCPGVSSTHQHGQSIGRDPTGGFYTRRLQTYPPKLCAAMARMIFMTLCRFSSTHTGPTGALSNIDDRAAPRTTSWSTWSQSRGCGVTLLNEAVSRRFSTVVNSKQSAVYVHVDDTVVISSQHTGSLHADNMLDHITGGLERIGFQVTQQFRANQLEKVVGYEIVQSPATFRLPVKKMALLREALVGLAGQACVHIDILRSLVGIWIFGALLRRELLSIPHVVFHFMEENEGKVVEWWHSARLEVRAMGFVTGLMECSVGSPIWQVCFGTDAMGASELDHGGYGIVGTELEPHEVDSLLRVGESPGFAIARLDSVGGSKYPTRPLEPTIPFTLLPHSLFDDSRWLPVEAGRWRCGDHITLGESRTVLKLVQRLGGWPALHGYSFFSLQDNRPTAGAMAKGRSASFALNRILRMKAGNIVAANLRLFLPWVESARQPADALSREV